MDNIGIVLIIVLVVLIFISAFFSGSETSITAINQIKLDSAAENGQKSAKRVNALRNKIDEVLGVILIGNNLVNISASALLTYFVIKRFGDEYVWVGTLLLTVLVIIFAEIAPKNFAAKKPEAIAYPASIVLQFLTKYFGWLSRILNFFSSWITGVKGGENYFAKSLNREELKSVLDKDTEQVDKEEMEAMRSLLALKELSVQDILIPINQVITLNLSDIEDFENYERNRFYPVYKDENSDIVGFIHSKEIEELGDFRTDLTDFLIEPYYVPESTQLFAQLKNFQKNGSEVALVVDEYGEVTGLVTLEDLIEQIVGQFNPDEFEEGYEIIDDSSVLAEGSTIIRELNKRLEWDLPEEGAKTLNGLIIDHLDQLPTNNVCIELAGYKLETQKIESNKVKEVKVSKISDQ
jgi:Mg2+/Co2+ transporter CorB